MSVRWIGIVLAAFLYSLAVNSEWIIPRVQGDASPTHLRIEMSGSADQSQYFAYINTVGRGNFYFGNAALREHENDPGGVLYGPILPGLLQYLTRLPVENVAMMMDLLCPFIAFLLFWIAARKPLGDILALPFTLAVLSLVSINWLRQVSPQVTILFFLAHIAVFLYCAPRSRWGYVARGAFIGVLVFVQIQLALYLLIVEGCDALSFLIPYKHRWREWMRSSVAFLPPFLIFLALRVAVSLQGDAAVILDTQRRFGLIPSRFPTYPELQLVIVAALGATVLTHVLTAKSGQSLARISILLLAALLALNQSIVTGFDALFRLYYPLPFTLLLWIAAAAVLLRVAGSVSRVPARWWQWIGSVGLLVLSVFSLGHRVYAAFDNNITPDERRMQELSIPDLVMWLRNLKEREIVAAPVLVADIIPALTKHSVLLNNYARFGMVSDAELADRLLLQRALFSASSQSIDYTDYGIVFGHAPGNLGARQRTWCRLKSFDRDSSCRSIKNTSFIVHTELLPLLQSTSAVDRRAMLDKYHVSILLIPGTDTKDVPVGCTEEKEIGTWKAYRCR